MCANQSLRSVERNGTYRWCHSSKVAKAANATTSHTIPIAASRRRVVSAVQPRSAYNTTCAKVSTPAKIGTRAAIPGSEVATKITAAQPKVLRHGRSAANGLRGMAFGGRRKGTERVAE